MLVRIKRQKSADTESYWQEFTYDGDKNVTVATVLDCLNYNDDLFDAAGNAARRIRWECSCMQKVCGACSMIINHKPALACNTFLKNLNGDTLVLEPLSKFPVVSDLIVDKRIIYENLKRAEVYLHQFQAQTASEYAHLYQLGKCLKCGLCLEVCPNYIQGEQFFGAVFANDSYFSYAQSEDRSALKDSYKKHFGNGCSKSFSCMDVCPANIPTLTSISKMNRGK